MSVRHHIDHANKLIVTRVSDSATFEQVLRANEEIAGDAISDSYDSLTIFEDLNRIVGPMDDHDNSLRAVSEQLSRRYGTHGTFKSAFVVSKEVDYGLLRMYIAYRGRESEFSGLFYDTREALDWLGLSGAGLDTLLRVVEDLGRAN